jgi:hypothetical protein
MLNRRLSPPQGDSHQQMDLSRSLANVAAVLNRFWAEYANRREIGMEPDQAVDKSLTLVLPSDQVDEVLAMLRGELDGSLAMHNSFEGRELKSALIERGDQTWHRMQALPDWPDCVAMGFGNPLRVQADVPSERVPALLIGSLPLWRPATHP